MKNRLFSAAVLLILLFIPFVTNGQRVKHPTQLESKAIDRQQQKLKEFFHILTGSYLDTINYSAVVEKGIVSMLAELDPHSVYLTADEQKVSQERMSGSFSGIGIEFNVLNDTMTVINTITGGPAEKVGVLANDRIIAIDGENSVGIKRADVPKFLRGEKRTKVKIRIYRGSTGEMLDFTITRDDIPLNTVDAVYKVDERTGYIKVNRFGATTGREFNSAFSKLGSIDALIVDLRGNGGGYMPEAIRMSEFFLNRGNLILSTEGNMYPPQSFSATRNGRYDEGRVVILVDEGSASASEIVSGAVQDWDRGIIVGTPTFGKGLVQREFKLKDGSALRITTSKYLTPTGRAIQRPYEMGHKDEYYRDFVRKRNRNVTDSLKELGPLFHTLKQKRPVYGNGGIYPDVYVASDTTGYSGYWSKLIRGGHLHGFIQYYLDDNRAQLTATYPDFESYLAGFDAEELMPKFVDYVAEKGVEPDPEGLKKSQEWLSAQIKALIAGRLWDTTAYYRVTHGTLDNVFKKAYEMLRRWDAESDAPVSEELIVRLSE